MSRTLPMSPTGYLPDMVLEAPSYSGQEISEFFVTDGPEEEVIQEEEEEEEKEEELAVVSIAACHLAENGDSMEVVNCTGTLGNIIFEVFEYNENVDMSEFVDVLLMD